MTRTYNEVAGDGGSNIVAQVGEQNARLRRRMAPVGHKIAIASGKGGVGKSLITASLAYLLADSGNRVGVLDADLSGPSLARMLGVQNQRLQVTSAGATPATGTLGLKIMSLDFLLASEEHPVMWKGPADNMSLWQGAVQTGAFRELLADTDWGELDFLLLDLPPGTDRLPMVAQLLPELSGAVLVTIPSSTSNLIVRKTALLAQELGIGLLGLVENMAEYHCPNCGSLGQLFSASTRGEETAESLGIPFLGRIPFDPLLSECTDKGEPFVLGHRDSIVATALRDVASKIETLSKETER